MEKIILGYYAKDADGTEHHYAGRLEHAIIPKNVELIATKDSTVKHCVFLR